MHELVFEVNGCESEEDDPSRGCEERSSLFPTVGAKLGRSMSFPPMDHVLIASFKYKD